MREVMDAFTDPKVHTIVGMYSAQMAKTTVIENAIGYHVHHDAAPIMWVLPTLEIAESMSKDRLAPMIRDTPALRERFVEPGSKTSGDTLLHKRFPGGHVTLAGANSFNSLASRPIRIVIGDEAAKWRANEKGSPFRQVSARIRAFWNGKRAFFSTPTDQSPENEFHQLWEQSDKRIYHIPCPHCGELVVLTFDKMPGSLPTAADLPRATLQWTEATPYRSDDGRTIRRASEAWFKCGLCHERIIDSDRHRAVRQGEYRATQQFAGVAGFWGWTGMSPFVDALFIANEWLGALGSSVALQSVKNETLGLPWAEQGDAPEWKRILDRQESYELGTVPEGVLLLTAGVDVQADRLEVQVIGWGRDRRAWLVDYQSLYGDTTKPEVYRQLDAILGTVYEGPGGERTIRKLAIDSGFRAPYVYDWARRHKFGPVAVVKGGSDTTAAAVGTPKAVELTVGGKQLHVGVKVHVLNVGFFKSELYGRLRLELPNTQKGEDYPSGFFHICATEDTEEYCRQLTAEHLVTKMQSGFPKQKWERLRRNEALDTWVYARAAAEMLSYSRFKESQWAAMELKRSPAKAVTPEQPAAPIRQPIASRPPQNLAAFRPIVSDDPYL